MEKNRIPGILDRFARTAQVKEIDVEHLDENLCTPEGKNPFNNLPRLAEQEGLPLVGVLHALQNYFGKRPKHES